MTFRSLCTNILLEINAVSPGETPSAADIETARTKVNLLFSDWNAERAGVWASAFTTYTLTPSLNPHTIGPTGTWVVAQRPLSIESASLILTDGTQYPISIRQASWWTAQGAPTLTTTLPTDLYYQPDWPNGSLYFGLVPSVAYSVQLQTRVVLATAELADTVSFPPGYENAITLTGAEMCAIPFSRPMPEGLPFAATKARARIFANNVVVPVLTPQDAGLPSGRGGFDWISGR